MWICYHADNESEEGVIHYTHRRISFEGRFVKEIIAGGTPSISRQGLGKCQYDSP